MADSLRPPLLESAPGSTACVPDLRVPAKTQGRNPCRSVRSPARERSDTSCPSVPGSAAPALRLCLDTSSIPAPPVVLAVDAAGSTPPSARRRTGPVRAADRAAWERKLGLHPFRQAAKSPPCGPNALIL